MILNKNVKSGKYDTYLGARVRAIPRITNSNQQNRLRPVSGIAVRVL
jgi:hypothetical protein